MGTRPWHRRMKCVRPTRRPAQQAPSVTAQEVENGARRQRGGKVTVAVEIDAEMPEGLADGNRRVIDENCQVLRFKNHGFETA